jgi:hypothetical protein
VGQVYRQETSPMHFSWVHTWHWVHWTHSSPAALLEKLSTQNKENVSASFSVSYFCVSSKWMWSISTTACSVFGRYYREKKTIWNLLRRAPALLISSYRKLVSSKFIELGVGGSVCVVICTFTYFICVLFKNAVIAQAILIACCIRVFNEKWIGRGMEGSSRGLI